MGNCLRQSLRKSGVLKMPESQIYTNVLTDADVVKSLQTVRTSDATRTSDNDCPPWKSELKHKRRAVFNEISAPSKLNTKPKRKQPIPATVKRLVWNTYIGECIGKSKCYCCRVSDITQLSFHCGHVVSEKNGGKITVENLRPICQNCNSSMRTTNMNEFIEKHGLHNLQPSQDT